MSFSFKIENQCVWAYEPGHREELTDLEHFSLLLAVTISNATTYGLIEVVVVLHFMLELLWNLVVFKEVICEEVVEAFVLNMDSEVCLGAVVYIKVRRKVNCYCKVHFNVFILDSPFTPPILMCLN